MTSENSLLADRLHAMLHQEFTSYPACPDYTSQADHSSTCSPHSRRAVVNDDWRRKICEWAFGVVDHFEYSREAVSLTMNYLDRYASYAQSKGMPLSRKSFQLAAVASLYLAIKLEGRNEQGQRLTISTLVELSRGLFSVELIEQMEREILTALRWKINPPTAAQFIYHLIKLFPVEGIYDVDAKRVCNGILETSRFFSELSVYQSSLAIEQRPSIIAYSCILNAMELVGPVTLPCDVRQAFLTRIAGITQLREDMMEVYNTRTSLRELHSAITDAECGLPGGSSSDANQGTYDTSMLASTRVSPVCVSGRQ